MVQSLADYVSYQLRPSKILLVEDDESVSEILVAFSQKFNCELIWVKNRLDAEARVLFEKFDLAFLDVRLPEGSGIDVFRFMRSNKIETPVVFLTGFLDMSVIDEAQSVGVSVFVRKPSDFTLDKLKTLFTTFGIKPRAPDDEVGCVVD